MSKELADALLRGDADATCYDLRDFGNALAIVDSRQPPEKSIVWAGPASDRALAAKELANQKMRARVAAVTAAAEACILLRKEARGRRSDFQLGREGEEAERIAMKGFLGIKP
jgi:hypothetical protein